VRDHDHDELIARVARHLQAPVGIGASFDARVMAQVEALPRHRPPGTIRGAWDWLLQPRALRLSPLTGLGLAAGLVALTYLAAGRRPETPATPAAADAGVLVASHTGRAVAQFSLLVPHAKSVSLVGDFNDWDPAATPLRAPNSGDLWTVTVSLPPGRHRYAFIVDGVRWLADPGAPSAGDDDFGTPNSVVTVGAKS
jgi:AMP-activated protein kinase-like protein